MAEKLGEQIPPCAVCSKGRRGPGEEWVVINNPDNFAVHDSCWKEVEKAESNPSFSGEGGRLAPVLLAGLRRALEHLFPTLEKTNPEATRVGIYIHKP